ncbi:galactan 5-O-arabinofuranosyltransferase [Nocardia jinanensis]|uniref:Galactan 5-O-arabinofuranosyltransferase n=1 Tax=Nocardia jinanensis TaxID=382504 RepID=A0A917VWQ9_9NOCA|nr:galactan 5-O-arabinofuranosyltransferase [Nocardia jinanensis]GGL37361.1 arabinofuranosyltransferase AftA [Nocardia jinanensis]
MTTSRGARLVRQVGAGVGEAVLATVVAVVVVAVGLIAFSLVQWPAFNSSNVVRALTTVGQVGAAALIAGSIALLRSRRSRRLAKLLSWTGISAFVTVTLGMPLAATKLYLFGISVDQEFRTEYLTRLTDSAALRDMTYADLPPFYPAGWFWLGGRVANLLGMDGWEVFKPYAIGSIAVAAVVSLVLWTRLIRADWAVGVTSAVTAVAVTYAAPEAYGAVIAILLPPVLVMAWGALYRPAELTRTTAKTEDAPSGDPTAGGWAAVVGTGLFLGIAAACYTLYFAFAVFTVVLMAVVAAGLGLRARYAARTPRRIAAHTGESHAPVGSAGQAIGAPLLRLIVMGVIAALVALPVFLPFLIRMLDRPKLQSGGAFHYLPEAGSELPMPMAHFSLLGALCLVGVIWLVMRASSSRRAQSLGLGVLAVYLWSLLSMLATAAGSTLLSFRLEPVLLVLLAAAGGFGFVEGARAVYQALNEPARFRWVAIVLATVGALAYCQDIPHVLAPEITTAYTDTDGDGNRADQRDPSAVRHYRNIDNELRAQTGREPSQNVVLTGDTTFLAYYPYFGFQGMTSHYANPLADYADRSAAIEAWSEKATPDELLDAMNAAPWRAPDAFLFRRSGDEYTLRLAADVYPNDPNVKRYTVAFPAKLFDDPRFTTTDIGPFTLVVVKR